MHWCEFRLFYLWWRSFNEVSEGEVSWSGDVHIVVIWRYVVRQLWLLIISGGKCTSRNHVDGSCYCGGGYVSYLISVSGLLLDLLLLLMIFVLIWVQVANHWNNRMERESMIKRSSDGARRCDWCEFKVFSFSCFSQPLGRLILIPIVQGPDP